ncbi:uridine diphosphate glucose pyrophosphatase NUDT22-like isoform X2 [Ptychodera flava]|uniref:uridine diphosphate glucose pyrophosphatase NUDT22-like isoform X2 n=1 Tax=Ptychodera flava TaxID=63121 RepID=UPI003969F729
MDPDICLWFTSPGTPKSSVRVVLGVHHNRKVLDSHEKNIELIWARRREKNPRLFNGSKFRLHSSDVQNGTVTLNMGLTCYKDYLGTNWAPDAKTLHHLGKRDFDNSQAYLSDPAGVGAMVQTSDGYVIFIRRSDKVGEAPGLWDVPGGHPEPQELLILLGKDKNLEIHDIPMDEFPHDAVVEEIYDSIIREIRDEVNIPVESLSEPLLLGVAGNNTSAGRPSIEFYVKCSLSSNEVKALYSAGGPEAEESTSMALVHLKDVLTFDSNPMWNEMAPSAKGCVKLFQASRKILEKGEYSTP